MLNRGRRHSHRAREATGRSTGTYRNAVGQDWRMWGTEMKRENGEGPLRPQNHVKVVLAS